MTIHSELGNEIENLSLKIKNNLIVPEGWREHTPLLLHLNHIVDKKHSNTIFKNKRFPKGSPGSPRIVCQSISPGESIDIQGIVKLVEKSAHFLKEASRVMESCRNCFRTILLKQEMRFKKKHQNIFFRHGEK